MSRSHHDDEKKKSMLVCASASDVSFVGVLICETGMRISDVIILHSCNCHGFSLPLAAILEL